MSARFHPVTVILAVGAVIWFFVAATDMTRAYLHWADISEDIRGDLSLSQYLYSLFDSLFLLGSAAMVEFLRRIAAALDSRKRGND